MIGAGQLLFVLNRLRRSHTDRSVKPCRYASRTSCWSMPLLERWHPPQSGFRELTICCWRKCKPRRVPRRPHMPRSARICRCTRGERGQEWRCCVMVGRAFVAEVVSPADTGGGHRFHSAGGTSDDGRVAWRSVSRLQQRWQPPGLTDLLHSHCPMDRPSMCLAMCSCPDRSLRSERRLHWFVGSVLVAASTSSKSARGPSAWAESMITVITGAWATVADGSTTGARWSRPGHDRCAAP